MDIFQFGDWGSENLALIDNSKDYRDESKMALIREERKFSNAFQYGATMSGETVRLSDNHSPHRGGALKSSHYT